MSSSKRSNALYKSEGGKVVEHSNASSIQKSARL